MDGVVNSNSYFRDHGETHLDSSSPTQAINEGSSPSTVSVYAPVAQSGRAQH